MKKLIKNILNVFIYVCLLYSVLVAGFYALPVEIQEKVPQINNLFLLVSGGSTLILGSVPLIVKWHLNKNTTELDAAIELILKLNQDNQETKKLLKRNNDLVEMELRSRLDNDFISQKIKDEIEGVLSE